MATFIPKNILIIKIRALGDTLLTTPALRALRQAFPQSKITALVSAAGAEVLANNPNLNCVEAYTRQDVWNSVAMLPRVWVRHYDLVIALHASFRTALLALATQAPKRVVHNHSGRNYFGTVPVLAKKESKSIIQRDLDAIRALGLPDAGEQLDFVVLPEHKQRVREILKQNRFDLSQPLWVLAPGAGKERKRWTAAAAIGFLNGIQSRRPSQWIILAGPQEQELAQAISQGAQSHPLVFNQNIQTAGALLSSCHGLVTTDSGPKHVAVAVGARTLTLWTDEPIAEWHPYAVKKHALVQSPTGIVADIPPELVMEAFKKHFK